MPEQLSPLARSDRHTVSMDTRSTRRATPQKGSVGGPDPMLLTITGVLLFVVLMLVVVFRTLYPVGT